MNLEDVKQLKIGDFIKFYHQDLEINKTPSKILSINRTSITLWHIHYNRKGYYHFDNINPEIILKIGESKYKNYERLLLTKIEKEIIAHKNRIKLLEKVSKKNP
ncbi:MAG: hypothetical protein WCO35_01640 [Candidatus Nomurabacteria bacterium]